MNCFGCFRRVKDSDISRSKKERSFRAAPVHVPNVQTFNFRELAMATNSFRQECLLGKGGFGRVFKGKLQRSGQVVAVKQLDRNGMQENQEFTVEVTKLSHLKHPNLVNLIGYCSVGDQRLLVYEYMPLGSLKDILFGDDADKKLLDWDTRMKIASGAAQGLEYLHEKAIPSVIYGHFKPSHVLLNEDFEPKLADVGLSKLGPGQGANQSSPRVMDTGYSAPEYFGGGEVSLKSDVYSFGVVLLELITGRRALDTTRPTNEQNLVSWAQTFFRDPKRFPEMADPRLKRQFPETGINHAVGIAAMCLQHEPMVRPFISDVTAVLSCISMIPSEQTQAMAPSPQQMEYENEVQKSTPTSQDQNSAESRSSVSSSDSEATKSKGATKGESAEQTKSRQLSDGKSESGSDSDRVGQSPQRKNGTSKQTIVTFKEPSASSKYSTGRKSSE